jgi:hypothetical protein
MCREKLKGSQLNRDEWKNIVNLLKEKVNEKNEMTRS